MNTFSERLQVFLDVCYPKKNLHKFVFLVNINTATVYRYLSGDTEPKASVLRDIEEKAGCSVSWLLTGNGEMYAQNEIGRALYKEVTGKDVPQTGEQPLDADTKENLRQHLLNSLKLIS